MNCRVQIFAKAPVSGKVKTRLIPAIGAADACELHKRMAEEQIRLASSIKGAELEIYCANGCDHPWFRKMESGYAVKLREQEGRDLGDRMYHALSTGTDPEQVTILVGTDVPVSDVAHYEQVMDKFDSGNRLVLGPVEDGGYWLIAVREPHKNLFRDIDWGSATVADQTRERVAELGWKMAELSPLWDVDRPEDLERLRACGLGHLMQGLEKES